jgi:deazaflavin-dependent oxidoreductase (nitroreductase family)
VTYYGSAVLERFLPRPWQRRFQRRFGNPGGQLMSVLPGWGVIETTGRRSGQPRQVPVGGRSSGDSFWVVAADPAHAGYVRNIEADPRVRVKFHGRWRDGVAHPLPDDDARRRMFWINPLNGLFIWIAGRDHTTIRIELTPTAEP